MADRLLKRKEVPVEETWDLSLLYKTEEDMNKDVKRIEELAKEITKLEGKLNDPKAINDCLSLYEEYRILRDYVNNYVGLAVETDRTDSELLARNDRIDNIFNELSTSITFMDNEIARADEDVLKAAMEASERHAHYLKNVLDFKPHMLSDETEKALTSLSQTLYASYDTYLTVKLSDMKFPDFEVDGRKYHLGYSLFEDDYEYDSRTLVRRAAFRAFSDKLKDYRNVTGEAYNQCVRCEKSMADLRGFDSVFDYLLFDQKVTRDLYDRQIDLITSKLSVHMRKYARLIKKLYKLDKMTFADLKLPVDPDFSPKVTIKEAREYCVKGLSIMGPEYVKMVEEAFDKRWFDFANNEGKCTGGFCSSPYRKNSYILLSFNGRMSDVFTMVHELGHAGHFRLCGEAQGPLDTDASTYFVEAPSTMNELLFAHYLIKTSDDPRFKRWVLANMVGNTYYHNFVTHLLEAAYQREVYKLIEEGESVQADVLDEIYRKVLSDFWGDDVELTEGAEITWMRQPHYYMGLYSYTYSAGLTIATEVCERIEKEGMKAVDDWKKCLAMGGTVTPLEFAKNAGVDISTDAPLLHTIGIIGDYIDEICRLTEELGE